MVVPRLLVRRDQQRVLWIVFALLCALLLPHLGIYLIDHHSTSLIALAAVVTAAAVGGIAVSVIALQLPADRLVALRAGAAGGRDLYLALTLVIALGFGIGMRPEWVYVHAGLMLGMGFALGYLLLYADAPPLSCWWTVVVAVGLIVVTLVRIGGLSVYPVANINDEPWDLGWALSYLRNGTFSDTIMYYGGFDIQRFMLPVAWWISLFGHEYWHVRLFFFLLIFPLIGLTGLAARNLYGNGWITALVMFSSAVVMGGARLRHDIGLALAVAASLWLYTEARKRNKHWLHLLAGLAIGLGWFAHYHATVFGAALAIAFYAPDYVERLRQRRWLPEIDMWLFVLGGLMGAGAVFVLQVLPDWEGFLSARQPRNPVSLGGLVHAFVTYWQDIGTHSQLELVLVLIGIIAALWRHKRRDVMLILLVVLLHLALALAASAPFVHYIMPISPVYGILIAAAFTEMLGTPIKRSAALATAGLVMAINLGVTLHVPLVYLAEGGSLELPMPPVAAWIRANVSPSERIVTEHWYYLWLTDYNFVSPLSVEYAPLSDRLDSDAATWDQISPDVVVIDRNLSTCCVQEPIYDAGYLKSRGYQEVTQLPGDQYPVLVYEKASTP